MKGRKGPTTGPWPVKTIIRRSNTIWRSVLVVIVMALVTNWYVLDPGANNTGMLILLD